MKRSKFSAEQIAYALRQADAGTPVGDVCCQLGVSDENNRLKRLVADLTLDKHMLSEALRKKPEACAPSGARRVVSGDVPGQLRARLSPRAVQSRRVVSA